MHAGLFQCFHGHPNSDTGYRIFNMHKWFFCLRTHTGDLQRTPAVQHQTLTRAAGSLTRVSDLSACVHTRGTFSTEPDPRELSGAGAKPSNGHPPVLRWWPRSTVSNFTLDSKCLHSGLLSLTSYPKDLTYIPTLKPSTKDKQPVELNSQTTKQNSVPKI